MSFGSPPMLPGSLSMRTMTLPATSGVSSTTVASKPLRCGLFVSPDMLKDEGPETLLREEGYDKRCAAVDASVTAELTVAAELAVPKRD
eukprot:CAMPEP_0183440560 /NCGR_PEP_ID=MMETSP0370-20130417/81924_1 /TAXON_ID=268820 /ORGANISM="Peridinium aciculiferum, Strain PAER-2" /LENGTH=88 /DNA_ID=CAMNT_0025629453 /DNA_START=254 /DNA_END=520 /DNA_ORIENTATION=+